MKVWLVGGYKNSGRVLYEAMNTQDFLLEATTYETILKTDACEALRRKQRYDIL